MNRPVSELERIQSRVNKFVREVPQEVIASLRIDLMTTKYLDSLRKEIRKKTKIVNIEYQGWKYYFWDGEWELNELLRRIL